MSTSRHDMQHMPDFVEPLAPITDRPRARAAGSTAPTAASGSTSSWASPWSTPATAIPRSSRPPAGAGRQGVHAQMNIYRHAAHAGPRREALRDPARGHGPGLYANSGAEAVENAVKLAKQAPAPPRHHRLPGRLPRPHAPHHGAHRLGRALPRPHAAAGRRHLPRPLLLSRSARRPARIPPSTPSKTCAACCAPRSTATTSPHPGRAHPGRGRLHRADAPSSCSELRGIADEIGACLIIDEIQAGMGRTGKWFCHEHYGVTPDIITIAKGIASGYPLAGHRRPQGAVGQVHARLHGRHLRRQRRGLRRGLRHHRRHARRRHAGQRRAPGRQAHGLLHATCRPDLPGHRRRARQGPHGRPSSASSPAASSPTPVRGQGLHRRVPSSATSSSWAPAALGNCVRFLPPLTSATPTWTSPSASSTRPPRSPSPELRDPPERRPPAGRPRAGGRALSASARPPALFAPASRLAAMDSRPCELTGAALDFTTAGPRRRPVPHALRRYAETDAAGVVYYGDTSPTSRSRASSCCAAWACPSPRSEARGLLLPVVEARLKYLRPARLDDLLDVDTVGRGRRPGLVRLRLRGHARTACCSSRGSTRLAVCERADAGAPSPCRNGCASLFGAIPATVMKSS